MLIYEVNLEVDEDINYRYAGWLPEHINKMLKFKGFQAAYWFFRKPEDEGRKPTAKTLWTIQYVVQDRQCLDEYLTNHANGMRKEALDNFGTKFKAERRILNLLSAAGLPPA
jgi:hypothetical protein